MKLKASFIILISLFSACAHPKPQYEKKGISEYRDNDFTKLYQKDRSYDALNNDLTAITDRILTFSAKNWSLNQNENKMIEGYIRQNKIFELPEFNKAWLDKCKAMFDRIFNDEQNMVAPALYQKFEDLYLEAHPNGLAAPNQKNSNYPMEAAPK